MEPKVITVEKYECPVCRTVFDYEDDCERHISLCHDVGDLSYLEGKIFTLERDGRFDIVHVHMVDGAILIGNYMTLWTEAKEWEYSPNSHYYMSVANKSKLVEVTFEEARELWTNRVRHLYETEIDEALTTFEDLASEV